MNPAPNEGFKSSQSLTRGSVRAHYWSRETARKTGMPDGGLDDSLGGDSESRFKKGASLPESTDSGPKTKKRLGSEESRFLDWKVDGVAL